MEDLHEDTDTQPQQPATIAATAPPRSAFTNVGLEDLRQQLAAFAAERHWEKYHTPRNLLLALVGEVGELSEIFQWRGEVPLGLPGFTAAERTHVGQELSDVLLYLVRLADACGVDLGQAVADKLAHNAKKYPADKCRGSAAKYTAYAQEQEQQQHEVEHTRHQQGQQRPQQQQQDDKATAGGPARQRQQQQQQQREQTDVVCSGADPTTPGGQVPEQGS